MDWKSILSTILTLTAVWIVQTAFRRYVTGPRDRHRNEYERPNPKVLFINGERDQVLRRLDELASAERATARRVADLNEVMGDYDRRMDDIERHLRKEPGN